MPAASDTSLVLPVGGAVRCRGAHHPPAPTEISDEMTEMFVRLAPRCGWRSTGTWATHGA
jgi:hypothetical protein